MKASGTWTSAVVAISAAQFVGAQGEVHRTVTISVMDTEDNWQHVGRGEIYQTRTAAMVLSDERCIQESPVIEFPEARGAQ